MCLLQLQAARPCVQRVASTLIWCAKSGTLKEDQSCRIESKILNSIFFSPIQLQRCLYACYLHVIVCTDASVSLNLCGILHEEASLYL